MFEVVAIDEEDGTIEVQHFDGTVEEIDLEAWEESVFESVEPPEDYSGSFDMDREDYFADQENGDSNDYASALDYLDRAE